MNSLEFKQGSSPPETRVLAPTLADRAIRFAERHQIALVAGLLLVVLLRAVVESNHKLLWYDEVFTVFVATQPNWHQFAGAMPPNGTPPLQPALVRACIRLFGTGDLVIRMPSILAFLAALVGVFVFVRRECGAFLGIAAVVLTMCEPGWTYAYEARPYTLLLAFLMLALVSWQGAVRSGDNGLPRRLAIAGLALGIIGSIFSHHIGVIEVGLPLLAGEAVRVWRTRRTDWPILLTGLVATLPSLLITVPMARATHALLLRFPQAERKSMSLAGAIRAAFAQAGNSIWLVLSGQLLLVLLLALLVLWRPRSKPGLSSMPDSRRAAGNHSFETVRPEIIAAAAVTALMIPITMVFMNLTSGYFNCRYGIGTIAGVAILAALLFYVEGRGANTVVLLITLCFGLPYVRLLPSELHHYRSSMPQQEPFAQYSQGLPVVVADPFEFVPAFWYAPKDLKSHLVYLVDPQWEPIIQMTLLAEAPFAGMRIEDYDRFIAANPHFIELPTPQPYPPPEKKFVASGFTLSKIPNTNFLDVARPDTTSARR